jgi:glutamate carboxypeptidase
MESEKLMEYCRKELRPMLRCLKQAVEIESPSRSKPHVDSMAKFFAQEFQHAGGKARILAHTTSGSAVLAEFAGAGASKAKNPVLILGHLDTVWEVGTLKRMPFRLAGGLAYGPGIFDMKAGIVIGLWAMRALAAGKTAPAGPVRFLLTPDEEISSLAFRKQILAEARRSRAVLVIEPAASGGALKTARKGVGEFRVTVQGRSAHAGINPAAGVNAITELARQILRIEHLAQPKQGLTVSVGLVQGGTRTNVVPESASATVDVRIPRLKDRQVIEWRMRNLKPFHPEARLIIEGGINRPPLERKMAADLFRKAKRIGSELGMDLREAATGGGSDGNFTAALGIPTLDGLGAVGDGAHALNEHVVVDELPPRAALLAALVAEF